MTIEDTYWKCFILDETKGFVYGMISEDDKKVVFQWLGNAGQGKFYVMSTHVEPKDWFKRYAGNVTSTTDYKDAYSHMTHFYHKKHGY